MKKVALALALFLAASAAFGGTPHEALERAAAAMDNGDAAAFQGVIDIDSVLEKALRTVAREAKKPETRRALPQAAAFIFDQAGDEGPKGEALRGLIISEGKAFVLNGVSSGVFAGKKIKAFPHGGLLTPLFSNVSLGRKEIVGIGDARPDGEEFLLPFSLRDYGNDQEYAIVARFAPAGDDWRMVAIENFPELFEQIRKEALAQ